MQYGTNGDGHARIMLKNRILSCYDVRRNRKEGENMKRNIRMMLALAIYLIGMAASVYVGGWIMIIQPLCGMIAAKVMGTLTLRQICVTALKCISSLTVAGLIWCIGYMMSNRVFDSRDESI